MGKIEYTAIRKAFLTEFENNNTKELKYRANVRELERKIQKQTEKVKKIESEIEEIRPEFEDISNLEALFNIGGQALPTNNPAKEKLDDKNLQLQDTRTTLGSLKEQRNDIAGRTGRLSDNTYNVYLKIKKSDLSATSIKALSAYNDYGKIDRNLALIFAVTYIEDNRINEVDKSYLDDLVKAKNSVSGVSYELVTDKILNYRFEQELRGKVHDESLRRIYNQMSVAVTEKIPYEEYCLKRVGLLRVTEENGMWIAAKLNALFIKMRGKVFNKEQQLMVDEALKFVMLLEANGSYNSFILWKNIPLPEKMLTGNVDTVCSDVDFSFRVWMFRYILEITKLCEKSSEVFWKERYRQLCARFDDIEYRNLICELVRYAISEKCKKKKYWEGIELNDIVNTVRYYDEKNHILSKEFSVLIKAQKENVKEIQRAKTSPVEESLVTKKRTHVSAPHISYRLTASHMVVMMMEAVLVPCIISSGAGIFSVLIGAGTEGFCECVILFFLHTKDERMDRAETIVSSFSGFAINTIIVGGLMMLEILYLMKMGVDSFACAMGVVAAAVVYVIYLLFILFSKKENGGDK